MITDLLRVMYLEDDPSLSELAMVGLSRHPELSVLHCANGYEALEHADDFNPHLCLFDVMLPEMDGPTAYELIRQKVSSHKLPVIYMTAKAQRHEVKEYMDRGALGVIRKPFNPLTLGNEVENMWRQWA